MIIKLYNTPSMKIEVPKTKNNEITLIGTFKDGTTLLNPILRIRRNDSVLSQNYMYIDKFKRFYFIDNISIDGQEMTIKGTVDVLESFKNDFLKSQQIISRQESAFNLYIPDSMIQTSSKEFTTNTKLGTTPFDTLKPQTQEGAMIDFCVSLTLVNGSEQKKPKEEVKEGEL